MQGKARKYYYLAVMGIAILVAVFLVPNQKKGEPAEKKTEASETKKPPPAKPVTKKPALDPKLKAERAKRKKTRLAKQKTANIENEFIKATISNLNSGLVSYTLKGSRFKDKKSGKPIEIITTDKEEYFPLGMQLLSADTQQSVIDEKAFWDIEQLSSTALKLTYTGDDLRIVRKVEAIGGPYQLWVTTRIVNRSEDARKLTYRVSSYHYVRRKSEKAVIPFLPVRAAAISHGICHHSVANDSDKKAKYTEFETDRFDRETLLETHRFKGRIQFTGVEDVYFLKAIAPYQKSSRKGIETCSMASSDRGLDSDGEPLGSLIVSHLTYPSEQFSKGQSKRYRELAYFGPKMPDDLAKAGHSYSKAIDLGFFAIVSEGLTWLLRKINSVVGNWGIAIILLTLFVKVVLYPLTAKSFQSMARMRVLKPEMDRINELYKDDREKKGAAIMELYRKHKINPLGGCLPQLLQLPIWIALYTSLSTNIELFHAPFTLWWQDLSSPDPYYVLPVALGILMFLQQKMTPMTAMDPVQAKMMLYMMPTMMMAFMLFLPAGLCLYILTNSALTIGQQRIIERRLKKAEPKAPPDETETEGEQGQPAEDSQTELAMNVIGSRKLKPNKSKRRSRRGRK